MRPRVGGSGRRVHWVQCERLARERRQRHPLRLGRGIDGLEHTSSGGPDAPVRHAAKRRRLKTVMQELIYRAGRLISTGRKLTLGLGANDRSAKAFARLHGELFAASA